MSVDIMKLRMDIRDGKLVLHEQGGTITAFSPFSGEAVNLGPVVPKLIDRFDGPWSFLSNFHEVPITYLGVTYKSSEAAFQAQKCPSRVMEFADLAPGKAKRSGRSVEIVSQWDSIKLAVMREILQVKFSNHSLASLLNKTGDAELVEGNTWNDRFWGVCGTGENWLGRLLMGIRYSMRLPKEVNFVPVDPELAASMSAYLDYKIDVLGYPDEGSR